MVQRFVCDECTHDSFEVYRDDDADTTHVWLLCQGCDAEYTVTRGDIAGEVV